MAFDCTFGVRTLRWLTFGLMLLCICQTVILLGIVLGWHFKHRTSLPVESNRHCLACDDLQPRQYNSLGTDKDINALRQKLNTSQCCGAFSNVMQLLIQKEVSLLLYQTNTADLKIIGQSFIKEGELEEDMKTPKAKLGDVVDTVPSFIFREIIGQSFIKACELEEYIKTPKAKLVGVEDSVPSSIAQAKAKLRWNKNGLTFTENNCIHLEREGEIYIRKPGYYIVSSTLNINAMRRNNTSETFNHNVNLLSSRFGTTETLMQRTKSIKESDAGVFTSLISAVFKLEKLDMISVSVSHPEYIVRNSSADNFIVYFTYNLN